MCGVASPPWQPAWRAGRAGCSRSRPPRTGGRGACGSYRGSGVVCAARIVCMWYLSAASTPTSWAYLMALADVLGPRVVPVGVGFERGVATNPRAELVGELVRRGGRLLCPGRADRQQAGGYVIEHAALARRRLAAIVGVAQVQPPIGEDVLLEHGAVWNVAHLRAAEECQGSIQVAARRREGVEVRWRRQRQSRCSITRLLRGWRWQLRHAVEAAVEEEAGVQAGVQAVAKAEAAQPPPAVPQRSLRRGP